MTTILTAVIMFNDTRSKILGASSRVTPSLDLDLTFGAVDSNVDLACTHLLSPPSPPPPPLLSAPSSAAAGKPFSDPGVFTIIMIFSHYWWLSCRRLLTANGGGKDCLPLLSEEKACPSLFDCHGPWHWDLALARVVVALSAAQELRTCQKFKFCGTEQ